MTEDRNQIIAEHYHQFENLPVCVCVLETASGFFAVGYSSTAPRKFDAGVAQAYAVANARQALARNLQKWGGA